MRFRLSRHIALSETETLRARDRDQDFRARDRDKTKTGLETRPGLETSITGNTIHERSKQQLFFCGFIVVEIQWAGGIDQ